MVAKTISQQRFGIKILRGALILSIFVYCVYFSVEFYYFMRFIVNMQVGLSHIAVRIYGVNKYVLRGARTDTPPHIAFKSLP